MGIYAQSKVDTDAQNRERRRRWRVSLRIASDWYAYLPARLPSSTVLNIGNSDYISRVILYHEALIDFQLAPVSTNRGIIPRMRADTDEHPLPIPLEPTMYSRS